MFCSVYKHLTEEEIEKLTLEISGVRKVDSEKKEELLKNFIKLLLRKIIFLKVGLVMQKSS